MMLEQFLYKLAGEDHGIMMRCSQTTQKSFMKTGIIIMFLFVLCFLSSYFTFNQLFKNPFAVFMLSLFFSWMITNIYRFLIYALTRNSLPAITKENYNIGSLLLSSGFVCFISLIVSIPIESVLYSESLDADVKIHKAETKEKNRNKITFYYQQQIEEIAKLSKDESFKKKFSKDKEEECSRSIHAMCRLVDSSNYYLQRLRFLCTRYPSSWLLTFLFIGFFLYPVFNSHQLRKSDYCILKGTIEKRIVDLNYRAFKKKYETAFLKNFNQHVTYTEAYEDAPYNTVKKQDNRKYFTEENLLTELYNV